MGLLPSYPSTDVEAETRWLKRHGALLALAGFAAGILFDATRWAVITLDPSLLPEDPGGWFGAKGIAMGCAFALLPLLWYLGLAVERTAGPRIRSVPVAALLSILLVVAAEGYARSYFHQSGLWQAVRARAGSDYFAREVSLLRLEDAAQRAQGATRPGVVVAGSSQMLHALDVAALGENTGMPVYRRAVAGMFPMELCAARGLLDFHPDNVLLLMLSGFDLGGRDDVYTDAMRPLATLPGIRDFVAASSWPQILPRWRSYVDLACAAAIESWRSRDYVRLVFQHPLSPKRDDGVKAEAPTEQQRLAYTQLGRNPEMVALSRASLERFLASMAPRVRRIVVIEGQVNPAYPDASVYPLSATMKLFLTEQERLGVIDYWTMEEQDLGLTPADWLDMAHVNESGRAKYTALFARTVGAAVEAGP